MYQKSTVCRKKNWGARMVALAGVVTGALAPAVSSAQCGYASGLGCSNTDYANSGVYSDSNAATIEYDNFTSSFHSTIIRDISGDLKTWGALSGSNGTSSNLSPVIINATNYGITGTPLKAVVGSRTTAIQSVLLTTTGLWVWGTEDAVVDDELTTSTSIDTISLPTGVAATDVKMLFATYHTLALVTCDGAAYVLSQESNNRANGGSGSATAWSQVQRDATTYLTGVVALRGCPEGLIALTSSDSLFTWGTNTYLGNNTAAANRTYATAMALPSAADTIKMIGAAGYSSSSYISYYVLYTNGNLYSLGENSNKQLGDWTTTDRTAWVQPRYVSSTGTVMSDVLWISPSEHDDSYPSINIINEDHHLYNWGMESGYDLGRGTGTSTGSGEATDPGTPSSLATTDDIIGVETGGHTTMIAKKCVENFGYVGHRINGSMGNGSSTSTTEASFTYATASVQICGSTTTPTIGISGTAVTDSSGNYCNSQSITLATSPTGGTLSVSGPATVSGSTLTFNGTSGTVVVSYSVVVSDCDTAATVVTDTFVTVGCTVYYVSGTIWNDSNQDAVEDSTESGTNTGTTSGVLWANLVNSSGVVVASVPVNADGTYSLPTTESGTYSVVITNTQIATGTTASTSITTSTTTLPGSWSYTGTNVNGIASNTATNTITGIVVSGANSSGNDFGIYDSSTLPVELESFTGKDAGSCSVELTWNTAAEYRFQEFEVQYSKDAGAYSTVGTVAAQGDGSTYTYLFRNANDGKSYFRLKMDDLDGASAYSRVATVSVSCATARNIKVYPSPTHGKVVLEGVRRGENIQVFDAIGKKILDVQASADNGQIDLSPYAHGVYNVVVVTDNMERLNFKVVRR
ncbi:MAG: T9SS type A sorting domain-containing protein [Edaphocola sp.]